MQYAKIGCKGVQFSALDNTNDLVNTANFKMMVLRRHLDAKQNILHDLFLTSLLMDFEESMLLASSSCKAPNGVKMSFR